jgi:hypothetical protein
MFKDFEDLLDRWIVAPVLKRSLASEAEAESLDPASSADQ